MVIIDNYHLIKDRIREAAVQCGRNADEILLLPVSKTFPAETVQEAIDSGITVFGENKVQEAKEKSTVLEGDYSFHLIGHLQSNKAKYAVNIFNMIHGIDKVSTATKLSAEALKNNKKIDILLQVNTSGEVSKSGISTEEAEEVCSEILKLNNIELKGLMTIGPLTDNIKETSESFKKLRLLLEAINKSLNLNLNELSMGMSGDFETAVKEGSTIVRVGSAIFGKRDYSL